MQLITTFYEHLCTILLKPSGNFTFFGLFAATFKEVQIFLVIAVSFWASAVTKITCLEQSMVHFKTAMSFITSVLMYFCFYYILEVVCWTTKSLEVLEGVDEQVVHLRTEG